jgi:hypothetical protein
MGFGQVERKSVLFERGGGCSLVVAPIRKEATIGGGVL